jgi:ABC transport system ATP-binding/permease protein
VYSATSALQTAVLTAIVVAGKGAPTRGAVVLGDPILELYLTLALTAAVAALTGLALSATARSHDQILPMMVISVMLSMVFCGGLIPVTGRPILDHLSWAIPARWGFAATASTTDLRAIAALTPQHETLWSHDPGRWLLIALGAVMAGYTRWRTRLSAPSPNGNRGAIKQWLSASRRSMPMPHRLPRPEHQHTLSVAAGGARNIPVLLGEARST